LSEEKEAFWRRLRNRLPGLWGEKLLRNKNSVEKGRRVQRSNPLREHPTIPKRGREIKAQHTGPSRVGGLWGGVSSGDMEKGTDPNNQTVFTTRVKI